MPPRSSAPCAAACAGKNFTEGWVEFDDKAIAKSVAAGLNGQQIGGKRRSAYHFDLWCMKYLPKFKWDHLTEEIAYEKVRAELAPLSLLAVLSTAAVTASLQCQTIV